MEKYIGKSIFKKIAIGPAYLLKKEESEVRRKHIEDTEKEIQRFQTAKQKALEQLDVIYKKALLEVGEENAAVFDVHMMLLEDDDYLDSIYNIIQDQQVNAEYAVAITGDNFSQMFAQIDDDYMRERAADIRDISERLVNVLLGNSSQMTDLTEPVILIADDLAPSETVQLDRSKILAFVTRRGSSNSHTAILARTMNIPAVIGVDIQKKWNGKEMIVDGYTGEVIIEPDEKTLREKNSRRVEDERRMLLLKDLKGKGTVTKSGKKINLYANIGSVSDVALALQNDAEGIGLFRSEFLYLESKTYPTEEEQFRAYKMVAQNMVGKKVIVRTLDIGADKQVDYFELEKEENPAMGYRAIRICLDQREIFRTQLRAILRASSFGNISIMFPMIISLKEVLEIKKILAEVKTELMEQQIPYRDVEIGVMIETPAAVWISDELAKEVDFFSIGTNDLTQYTLAIDRQNFRLDNIYESDHPAVLRSIQFVVENAHKNGIWVGICGELAADTTLTETFVNMGIDELSVSSSCLLLVRDAVRMIQ